MAGDTYWPRMELVFVFTQSLILFWWLPIYLSILVLFPLGLYFYAKLTAGVCQSYERLEGKTVIVTGANIGIGLETAKDLAHRGGRIILACRSLEKGEAALTEIKKATGKNNVVLKQLDLTSFNSIRKFANEIKAEEPRFDILINNAGAQSLERVLTADKLETNFQTNHFGPFLLTNLLLDLMNRTGNARIVNVSSAVHWFVRTLDLDNLNSEKTWKPALLYARTKLANILFTKELARRLKDRGFNGITVNALHPGGVRTALARNTQKDWRMKIFMSFVTIFLKTAWEGAQTSVYLAVSEEVDGVTGEYFDDCKRFWHTPLSKDANLTTQLWENSVKLVSLKPDETIVW